MPNLEAHLNSDDVTHTSIPIGEEDSSGFTPQLLTDFRRINTQKLLPHTLESKYPRSFGLVDVNPLKSTVIEALKSEHISPSDAVKLVTTGRYIWDENPGVLMSDDEIVKHTLEEYEHFGIIPSQVVEDTVSALRLVIKDLSLPQDIVDKLLAKIASVEVNVGFLRGGGASHNGDFVYINPSDALAQARYLAEVVGVEVTTDMIKSLLIGQIAHEFGHIVDFERDDDTAFNNTLSASSVLTHEETYPVEFDNDRAENPQLQMRERFAMYFSYAVLEKMGLTREAYSDFKRLYLTMALDVIKHVSIKRLTDFVEEAKSSKTIDPYVRMRIQSLGDLVLDGHCIAQSFPLNQHQVYEALLRINTPQNRLERKLEQLRYKDMQKEYDQRHKGLIVP